MYIRGGEGERVLLEAKYLKKLNYLIVQKCCWFLFVVFSSVGIEGYGRIGVGVGRLG